MKLSKHFEDGITIYRLEEYTLLELVQSSNFDYFEFDKDRNFTQFGMTIENLDFIAYKHVINSKVDVTVDFWATDEKGDEVILGISSELLRDVMDETLDYYEGEIYEFFFEKVDYNDPAYYGMSWSDFLSR